MNQRLLTLALTAALSLMAVPALAQDNFPDVPENHWAYEAIENLKREGILVGYPDGTYKGPRALTRYELAVALNAAYQRLKNVTDGLADQIAELRRQMGAGTNGGDVRGLVDRLSALENQVRGMGTMKDDVDAMKKMADEFQKELASLGVDVEGMKKDLDAIKKQLGEKPGVKISGDANIFIAAGEGEDNNLAMGIDGRLLGFDEDRGDNTGILGDLNVLHELAIKLEGNMEGGPKWDATVVVGNMIGGTSFSDGFSTVGGFGNQSGRFGGTTFAEGAADVYIQRLAIDLSGTLPFTALVGRIGAQSDNPYLLRRADNTPYFDNDRWDNGDWTFDGALVSFDLGRTGSLALFGGRNNNRTSVNGVELQPVTFSTVGISSGTQDSIPLVQNTVGAQFKFGLGEQGVLSATYLVHPLTAAGEGLTGADKLEILGGQLGFKVNEQFGLKAGYGQTTFKDGGSTVGTSDEDNVAWFGMLNFKGSNFDAWGGYRRVEENYLAPGDWTRIGTNWSPRNIEDFQVGAKFNFNEAFSLKAEGIFGEVIGGSDYTSIMGKLEYGFGGGFTGMFGFEDVRVDNVNTAGADIRQRWTTLGIGYNMGRNTMFRLMYQYGDVENATRWGVAPVGNYKGSMLFSQVSIKF